MNAACMHAAAVSSSCSHWMSELLHLSMPSLLLLLLLLLRLWLPWQYVAPSWLPCPLGGTS